MHKIHVAHGNSGSVILAAPDIDVDIFKRDIASKIIAAGQSLTLYAATNDLALRASKWFGGYGRAGQSGSGMVVMRGMETIDASNVPASDLFGHSYFADTEAILKDIGSLICNGQRAATRVWLERRNLQNEAYWTIRGGID